MADVSWIKVLLAGCIAIASIGVSANLVAANSNPPNIQTPAPIIHLKDNLDEKDNLGFCIDTVGRGPSDRAHVHSCKPLNGSTERSDVQFIYDPETGHIMSAAYDNLCLEIVPTSDVEVEFHLSACENKPLQNFTFDTESSELHLTDDYALCLAAGQTSRSAGPFMSRDLQLNDCDDLDPALKQWVVVSK
ncbi:ricin-type beta-trefoil lectin domain protein [Lentilitoribacter sp. EG35]|uniref:ricin-type beta-trefoil lectin domain protein n=1 Tax=Lentilitoribacter sp. EG35 TaxID=3234192 RepID=UPI00345F34E1